MSKKKTRAFTSDSVLASLGLVMALFALLCLLSPATRLRFLTWPVHYLFGTMGFLLLSLLLLESGLHLMLRKWWKRYPLRVYFGLPLALIGLWLLLSHAFIDASVTPQSYSGVFESAFMGQGANLYFSPSIAGGLLGVLILSSLSGVGAWLGYLLSSLVLVLGLAVLFFPLIRRLFHSARANHAVAAAKRLQQKEEREQRKNMDFVIESSDPEDVPPSPIPQLLFQHEEEQEELPPAPNFNRTGEFALAGGSTLPTRKSLRTQRAVSNETEISGNPEPVSVGPRELATPPFSSYSSNPVRTSGLKEAVFLGGLGGKTMEPARAPIPPKGPTEVSFFASRSEPKPVAPVAAEPREEPKMVAPSVPEPVHEEPSIAEQILPETRPEEPKEQAPSLAQNLAPSIPVAPLPEPLPDLDEDEDFVQPSNDPIVIAPNPTSIIAPSTLAPSLPQEPEPEPEPEAKPVDDDLEGPLPPYEFPPVSLLAEGTSSQDMERIRAECQEKAALIDQIFADFGVGAHVSEFLIGPSITRYSISADPGVSVSTISRYIPDLEVRLGGVPVRFVERVLGLACSALEVANENRRIVPFKEVFTALPQRKQTADLHIPFGIDISGKLREADLAKFPHMLVAGTSGSGKSIFAHGILMSLVMRNRPEDLKLMLIDPKRGVEMAPYRDLPHLLCPIITEAKPAKNALDKLCKLMDHRYEVFAQAGVRDINAYNSVYALPQGKKRMPYIVVLVDEFSDLVGECKEISDHVLRIAQKARACGIHLIVATQRPDVKVITGTIKSNLLCRVALTVASSTDSQTILGLGGAEDLYGYGDMLIDCQELSKRDFVRAQGCLTVDAEMRNVCDFIRKQMPPSYDPDFLDLEDHDDDGPEIRDGGYAPQAPTMSGQELRKMADEDKYQYVKSVIMTREFCSISMIQREFEVGFPRAGKILARLQSEGIVASPGDTPNNSRGCRVLVHSGDEGTTE